MNRVFVFGSNTEGRHGAGAALEARQKWGAIYGQASGRQGNSYGIITKELRSGYALVTLDDIRKNVQEFIRYATAHSHEMFIITKIGCGLAGFKEKDIAPMFNYAPENCKFTADWELIRR